MRRSLTILALASSLSGSDWPRFRGPNGTGVSADTGLPSEFSKDKNVLWKAMTPKGNSAPVIVNGRIFLTAHEGDDRFVLCYDANSGKELWRRTLAKTRTETPNPINGFTTPSIATEVKTVVAFIPEFGLAAYDVDGAERWKVPLGPFGGVQGMAVSPVIADGRLPPDRHTGTGVARLICTENR